MTYKIIEIRDLKTINGGFSVTVIHEDGQQSTKTFPGDLAEENRFLETFDDEERMIKRNLEKNCNFTNKISQLKTQFKNKEIENSKIKEHKKE